MVSLLARHGLPRSRWSQDRSVHYWGLVRLGMEVMRCGMHASEVDLLVRRSERAVFVCDLSELLVASNGGCTHCQRTGIEGQSAGASLARLGLRADSPARACKMNFRRNGFSVSTRDHVA